TRSGRSAASTPDAGAPWIAPQRRSEAPLRSAAQKRRSEAPHEDEAGALAAGVGGEARRRLLALLLLGRLDPDQRGDADRGRAGDDEADVGDQGGGLAGRERVLARRRAQEVAGAGVDAAVEGRLAVARRLDAEADADAEADDGDAGEGPGGGAEDPVRLGLVAARRGGLGRRVLDRLHRRRIALRGLARRLLLALLADPILELGDPAGEDLAL